MKTILFLTGTRADFGKLKSLMMAAENSDKFIVKIFVTGMHLSNKYGRTIDEVYKCEFSNIFPYINHDSIDYMDRTLAKTIDGLSHYISGDHPDLIVIHGDRVEALAGAIVGSLNNILVAHVEGGELSGTVDEIIRHAISKMAHIHLVSNHSAAKRVLQMGELPSSIHVIGSPDLDVMLSQNLTSLEHVKDYYRIEFDDYAIVLFHPVTTELEKWKQNTEEVVQSLVLSERNYIVVYPNNDIGSDIILRCYDKIKDNTRFRIFPSIRFEYFLVLLKNASFIIGNSSAGVREAPYYGVSTIDIGTRQLNRASWPTILHCDYSRDDILNCISNVKPGQPASADFFGRGDSHIKFLELIESDVFWAVKHQKQFNEI